MNRRSDLPHSPSRTVTMLLAVIVIVAAGVRFLALDFGLPHTNTRPDETIIIDIALKFLRGDFRPVFYDYPWLYMWVLAGAYLVYYAALRAIGVFHALPEFVASWRVRWVPFFIIPRAISAAFGTATVFVVFRIARKLWGDATALAAALFLALSFLHVRNSHFAATDVGMTFLLMLSVGFLIEAHLSKRAGHFAAAGFIGGLAGATKYNALLLAVPLVISYLLNIVDGPERRKAVLDPRLLWYGVPFLVGFGIGVPFVIFDYAKVAPELEVLWRSISTDRYGLELDPGWIHHLRYSLRYGMGLPMLAAGIGGMVLAFVLEPKLGLLLFSFPIVYFIVIGSLDSLFFRYALPVVPFLCLSAARLITWGVERAFAAAGDVPRASIVKPAFTAVVVFAVVLPSAASTFQFDRIARRTDNRVVVARWFDQHVPPDSSVLMSGSSYGYVQFTRERNYQAWVWDRRRLIFVTDLDRRPVVGTPEWILLQESPLPYETQQEVWDYLKLGYTLIHSFHAFLPDERRIYDQQDSFFIPFARFRGVDRPGPNYLLYKRDEGVQ